MDAAAKGKQALAESKYQEAIEYYTAALKSAPTSPDYLIQRSTAFQRAKHYPSALRDANQAVIHAQKRAKREAIIEAQFRRGCALHSLERYGDAEFVFGIVKRMHEKHKMISTWMGRNQLSLDKLSADDERRQCHVKETPTEEEMAESSRSIEDLNTTSAPTASGPAPSAPQAPPQQTPREKIRHEWYQNNDSVFFTLFAKGVPKDKAQIDIQERSLSISFPLASGSDFEFSLDPLCFPVVPEKSIPKIMGTKIEITLSKATPGQKWAALETSDPSAATSASTNNLSSQPDAVKRAVLSNKGPSYPTSSKSGPKDWDKVVKDARQTDGTDGKSTLEDDDDYEGGDEANHFFKKLFKDSSPEVQRAMMKSYTESNGTALSTNWDEVSKGKVETVPPDGMEAKQWEK